MIELKDKIKTILFYMLAALDDDYKIEADRFGDIAESAETIGTLINENENINWDEGL